VSANFEIKAKRLIKKQAALSYRAFIEANPKEKEEMRTWEMADLAAASKGRRRK